MTRSNDLKSWMILEPCTNVNFLVRNNQKSFTQVSYNQNYWKGKETKEKIDTN